MYVQALYNCVWTHVNLKPLERKDSILYVVVNKQMYSWDCHVWGGWLSKGICIEGMWQSITGTVRSFPHQGSLRVTKVQLRMLWWGHLQRGLLSLDSDCPVGELQSVLPLLAPNKTCWATCCSGLLVSYCFEVASASLWYRYCGVGISLLCVIARLGWQIHLGL